MDIAVTGHFTQNLGQMSFHSKVTQIYYLF